MPTRINPKDFGLSATIMLRLLFIGRAFRNQGPPGPDWQPTAWRVADAAAPAGLRMLIGGLALPGFLRDDRRPAGGQLSEVKFDGR